MINILAVCSIYKTYYEFPQRDSCGRDGGGGGARRHGCCLRQVEELPGFWIGWKVRRGGEGRR